MRHHFQTNANSGKCTLNTGIKVFNIFYWEGGCLFVMTGCQKFLKAKNSHSHLCKWEFYLHNPPCKFLAPLPQGGPSNNSEFNVPTSMKSSTATTSSFSAMPLHMRQLKLSHMRCIECNKLPPFVVSI